MVACCPGLGVLAGGPVGCWKRRGADGYRLPRDQPVLFRLMPRTVLFWVAVTTGVIVAAVLALWVFRSLLWVFRSLLTRHPHVDGAKRHTATAATRLDIIASRALWAPRRRH